MEYNPKPIDTSKISLPEPLIPLLEMLAESNHDVWGTARLAQGWTYGPERDDVHKRHPCLVAYRDLPETEKEYDRRTAVETLKAILALGYQILSPSVEGKGR